jgi:hypothetical protein
MLLAVAIVSCVAAGSAGSSFSSPSYLVVAGGLPHFLPLVEILGPAGRAERVVSRETGYVGQPNARWSPDGAMIAWVAKAGISVERADGTGRRRIAGAPGAANWSARP